jgi:hypothetical protein
VSASGGLTVRDPDHPAGAGRPEKRMPVAERQRETRNLMSGSSAGGAWITGRIGAVALVRKEADAGRVSL